MSSSAAAVGSGEPLQAPPRNACFVCGEDNPNGMKLRFRQEPDGGVAAGWIPAVTWEGFPGIIHGGIVSTVLDEAMSKAVTAAGCRALTAELRVRLRHRVATGVELGIRGWVVQQNKRLIRTEAALTTLDGAELAHAWGTFLAP